MRAMIFDKYGTPDDLHLEDVPKPIPAENEVLIKMRASSINDWDWGLLQGIPFMNRVMFGFRKPKIQSLGSDVAGTIESVGAKVTRFKPGDEVFGDLSGTGIHGWGGFAEYHCAREDAVLVKPKDISFEQAASIPQAAVLAWQGLLKAQVKPGMQVLINGASGGTGSFAVQMAKYLGAEVTGTARSTKLDFLRELGCDHVVDFTKNNYTQIQTQYDVILDLMIHHSIFDYNRILKRGGSFVVVGGLSSRIIQTFILGGILGLVSRKKFTILVHKANKGMTEIIDLIDRGKIKPIIEKCFRLEETADAFRYFGSENKRGKVVVTLHSE